MQRAPYVGISLHAQDGRRVGADDIVQTVTLEIGAGKLLGGFRLPPVRVLEQQLGISKNTVQAAYDELVARGLVESRKREGIFVLGPGATEEHRGAVRQAVKPDFSPPLMPLHPSLPPEAIRLSDVFIDADLLPRDRIADCVRSVLHSPGLAPHYDAKGYGPLRECIAQRLTRRGLSVDADQVVVTTGSQQALDIVARCLSKRRIAVESPVYSNALRLFESLSCEVIDLPFDPFEPLPMQAWRRRFVEHRPSACYAITSYQNPTGYCYSTQELLELVDLANETGTALIEDDWGSDMLSGSEYRPSLRALAGDNVIYIQQLYQEAVAFSSCGLSRRAACTGARAGGRQACRDLGQRVAQRSGSVRVPRPWLLRRTPRRPAACAGRALWPLSRDAAGTDAARGPVDPPWWGADLVARVATIDGLRCREG